MDTAGIRKPTRSKGFNWLITTIDVIVIIIIPEYTVS
jgi:hypothetical protein